MPAFSIDDANELRRTLGELVRAVRDREETPDGQIETLGFLARDGAQSIAVLARRRRVRHQSMSSTVADLEAKGLVSRAPDPADARGVLVSLTGPGLDVIRESRVRRSASVLAAARRSLSPDELDLLARTPAVFDKLVAALLDG